jgi:hypothetical protein
MDNPFRDKEPSPLEAEVRRIARDEIRKAFSFMSAEVEATSGDDVLERATLWILGRLVESVRNEMTEEKEA